MFSRQRHLRAHSLLMLFIDMLRPRALREERTSRAADAFIFADYAMLLTIYLMLLLLTSRASRRALSADSHYATLIRFMLS